MSGGSQVNWSYYADDLRRVPNRKDELLREKGTVAIAVASDTGAHLSLMAEIALLRAQAYRETVFLDFITQNNVTSIHGRHHLRYSQLTRAARKFKQNPLARLQRFSEHTWSRWVSFKLMSLGDEAGNSDNKRSANRGAGSHELSAAIRAEFNSFFVSNSRTDNRFTSYACDSRIRWEKYYQSMALELAKTRYGAVLVWVERFVAENAIWRASLDQGLTTYVLNEGSKPDSYLITRDAFCGPEHDWASLLSAGLSRKELQRKSRSYLAFRIDSGLRGEKSVLNPFVVPGVSTKLPPDGQPGVIRVGLFWGSGDEREYTDVDSRFTHGATDRQLIRWFCEWAAARLATHRVLIRPHPRLRAVKGGYEEFESHLPNLPENVTLFKPGDNINSYELLSGLDLVVTNGSTVSGEAASMGISVIEVDTYRGIKTVGAVPTSYEELSEWLDEPSQVPDKMNWGALDFWSLEFFAGFPLSHARNNAHSARLQNLALEPFGKFYGFFRLFARRLRLLGGSTIDYLGRSLDRRDHESLADPESPIMKSDQIRRPESASS